MPPQFKFATATALLIAASALAGCGHAGAFDVDNGTSSKWNNLVAMVQFKNLPRQPRPTDGVRCPAISVLDGASAHRVYSGATQANDALRYQFAIDEVARDCLVDGDQLSLKIGVSGRAMLGPTGSPGSFTAPLRVVVVREIDQTPVSSKLYQVPASIAAGQTVTGFTLVTDPLNVPAASAISDYSIKVGFDGLGNAKTSKAERKATVQQAAADAPEAERPHRHHHRADQAQPQQ